MVTKFSEAASNLMSEMLRHIYAYLLTKSTFSQELNYTLCDVRMIDDDFSTIWVKWGPYDCKFADLPLTAMATIADNMAYR